MLRRIAILTLGLCLLALAGCNTMHGFGKDMERGGQKIQEKTGQKAQDW